MAIHDMVSIPKTARGAKVAMTAALRSPKSYSGIIPVDNAPVDAALQSDFSKYMHGMRKIMEAQVSRSAEADDILKAFEPVSG